MDIGSELLLALSRVYSFLLPYISQLLYLVYKIQYEALPFLRPLYNRLAQHIGPEILLVIGSCIVLFISFQVLNFATRVVMFWTRIFIRLAIYSAIVLLGVAVYRHGPNETYTELCAFGQKLVDHFFETYEKHERLQRPADGGPRFGNGYGNARTGWR